MSKRVFFLVPFLVLFGLGVAFYFGLFAAAERGQRVIPDAMVGKPVPNFDLASYRSDQPGLNTADLKGQPQLVNFFASWCVPCLAEHPLISKLAEEEGVIVNGIGYSDTPENIENWLKRHGNPYARVGVDETRRIGVDWGVSGVPETYLVDAEGKIVFKYGGPLTRQVIKEEILPLMKGLSR
ncbi:cytochrome c biogenesis protein CcmG/thiol:disulfide interchange protein DsbE [Aestuariispira insulae]|uniref:Cytochrome c biogenesis protein CcmG/thiol:disulfide interchange protein DsbE n=2 Tax=Aestuariispira insulae TaxID=1461337 RepID=A0A3D9HQH1_9PROT|nr:cytochrome c biogenesis protein CcmG/thiol:disulfide interchange protein DsbE [Aestuariispira insulae]